MIVLLRIPASEMLSACLYRNPRVGHPPPHHHSLLLLLFCSDDDRHRTQANFPQTLLATSTQENFPQTLLARLSSVCRSSICLPFTDTAEADLQTLLNHRFVCHLQTLHSTVYTGPAVVLSTGGVSVQAPDDLFTSPVALSLRSSGVEQDLPSLLGSSKT